MNWRIIEGADRISTDEVVRLLKTTYWANQRSREQIEKSMRHSDCCGVRLDEKQRFMGIEPETAVDMTDFTPHTEAEIRAKFFPPRNLLDRQGDSTLTYLISPEDCELFSACELHVEGKFELRDPDSFAIGAVTAGTLDLGGTEVRQGGSFFLPFAVKSLQIAGTGNCILIRPPRAG